MREIGFLNKCICFRGYKIRQESFFPGYRKKPEDKADHSEAPGSVDLAITSPPYWGLRDYNIEPIVFYERPDCKQEWCLEATAGDIRFRGSSSIVGNNSNPEIWKGTGKGHFCSLCYSSSGSNNQPNHTFFGKLTNPGYKTEGHRANLPPKCLCLVPERFAWGMVGRGWILRNKIVWHKPNHLPESVKDRLTKSYELIYHFVKQKSYYYNLDGIREPHKESSKERVLRAVSNNHKYTDNRECGGGGSGISKSRPNRRTKNPSDQAEVLGSPGAKYHREANTSIAESQYAESDYLVANLHPKGKNPGDLWSITTKPFRDAHFAVFPEDIPRKCIIAACPENGVVLDPFAGAGTTLKAKPVLDAAVCRSEGEEKIGITSAISAITISNRQKS